MRRLSMNTIQEVLRLKYLGNLSNRNIETLGIASKSAVSNYIARFTKSALTIDEALAMKEEALFAKLFPELAKQQTKNTQKPHPDWNYVHIELSKKWVTRQLLWEEYKEQHPEGYGYTQFKEYYTLDYDRILHARLEPEKVEGKK